MPQICTICSHPQRPEINAALISSESRLRNIAARFTVSTGALQRHKANHLPASLVKAAEIADVIEAGTLLNRLKALNHETAAVLREARATDSKNNELALKVIARLEKQIELEGKLLGELQEGSTVNVILSSEWLALRSAIMAALEPYPAARLAVSGAVKNAGR